MTPGATTPGDENYDRIMHIGNNTIRFPKIDDFEDATPPCPQGYTEYMISYKKGGATDRRQEKLEKAGFEITNIINGFDDSPLDIICGRWPSLQPVSNFADADMSMCKPADAAALQG